MWILCCKHAHLFEMMWHCYILLGVNYLFKYVDNAITNVLIWINISFFLIWTWKIIGTRKYRNPVYLNRPTKSRALFIRCCKIIRVHTWIYSKLDTFIIGHINNWTHWKLDTFIIGHIHNWTHSKLDTFIIGHIHNWTHSKLDTFIIGHIHNWAHS